MCIPSAHRDLHLLSHRTLLSHVHISPLHILWHVTLLCRIHIPPIYRCTTSRNTVIPYIVIIVTWILGISLLHMHVWFIYSCHMDSRSYYMYYFSMLSPYSCYIIVSRYWYYYSHYWTHELLICDVWNPTSIVPVSRYPVLCYQLSSGHVIMLHVPCTVLVLLRYVLEMTYNKDNLGMEETWQLTRSYRVDALDPYC